ncbi:MAG: hypothetical protein ACK58T_27630, partial [Phycisphaerae bacterium]
IWSHLVSENSAATDIIRKVTSYLDLEMSPASRFQIFAFTDERFVRVPKPAGGGRITGIPLSPKKLDSFLTS